MGDLPGEISRRSFLAAVGTIVATGALAAEAGDPPPAPATGGVRVGGNPPQGASFPEVLRFWRTAEALGFDSAFVYDHFMAIAPGPPESERCLEAWTLLSALAAKTRRIRVGVLVTGSTYRHPAIVAKMATTVDRVSEGRLILGLGAGWLEREHVAYGIPFLTKGGRAKRLAESVEVITRLLGQEHSSFDGKIFTLKDAPCEPKGLQKPRPPILIGGVGPKVVLPLAARHADIWHFVARGNDPVEARRLVDTFDQLCTAAGRDPKRVEKATSLDPHLSASPAKDVRAQLHALVASGIRHFVLGPPPNNDRGVLRWFATEILPDLRGA